MCVHVLLSTSVCVRVIQEMPIVNLLHDDFVFSVNESSCFCVCMCKAPLRVNYSIHTYMLLLDM